MEEAYRIASKAAHTRAAQGKQQYDKKVRSSVLEPGDRVLVKDLTLRGGLESSDHIGNSKSTRSSLGWELIAQFTR